MNLTLTNAAIVTPDEVFLGTVRCENGTITDLERGGTSLKSAVDLAGDFLLPGLVDVHTDNFERHLAPRPQAHWNPLAAAFNHDRDVIGAGITTVFDSVCVGESTRPGRKEMMVPMLAAIREARTENLLTAEHHIHLRCDLMEPELPALLEPLAETPFLQFISLLDDSASRHIHRFRRRLLKRAGVNADNIESEMARRMAEPDHAPANRSYTLAFSQTLGVTVADHDDTAGWQVEKAVADGIRIIEFPITMEAAEAATAQGLVVITGAPNLVRGGSHTGNVSAADLMEGGHVDILCSDYVPSSLLRAAFEIARPDLERLLPDAIAYASRTPAETFGFSDRGAIQLGKRADLVRVAVVKGFPLVRAVWRDGSLAGAWPAIPN